jgi:hypothetical protein
MGLESVTGTAPGDIKDIEDCHNPLFQMVLFSRRDEVVSNAHFSGSKGVNDSAVVHLEFSSACDLEVDPCLLQRRGDLRRTKLEITQGPSRRAAPLNRSMTSKPQP